MTQCDRAGERVGSTPLPPSERIASSDASDVTASASRSGPPTTMTESSAPHCGAGVTSAPTKSPNIVAPDPAASRGSMLTLEQRADILEAALKRSFGREQARLAADL